MFEELLKLTPLLIFLLIISLIFYQILSRTSSLLIFISILFAFYIIFRYVFKQVEIVYNPREIPLVTPEDLGRYTKEAGVELRELNETFQDYTLTQDDDEDDDE